MINYVINARCLIEIARGDETSKAVQWLKRFNEGNEDSDGTIDTLIINTVSEINSYTYAYNEYDNKNLAIALGSLRRIFSRARLVNFSQYEYYELSEKLSEDVGETQADLLTNGKKWPLEAITLLTIAKEKKATILVSKGFVQYFTEHDVEIEVLV